MNGLEEYLYGEWMKKTEKIGKRNSKDRRSKSAIQKGKMPLKIVASGTSFRTERSTNTFSPMGGDIRLISVTTITKIPNHTVTENSDAKNEFPKSKDRTKG